MKYLSVATLVAFSCFLFSACSNDADLTPYENKIAQLQTTLDSLTNGSGGGSSITLSPELQGKDALLNSQIEALKKELKDIEDKHKSDVNAKEKEIADLEEILSKIEGGADISSIRTALKTLQAKKEQQIKEQEANLAELEENKKKLEQDLLDATDDENKWKNIQQLETDKTYAQQKGLPTIGIVSVTLSRQKREEVAPNENDGEENSSEEVNTFLPYTTYEFIYDNGTEIRMNFYDHPKGQECQYYANAAFPYDCDYDDFRLIKFSNNSEVSWFRHKVSHEASKKWNYLTNLVFESKEYLDERRLLYSGDNKAYFSYRQNLTYDGLLKEDGTRETPNENLNPETPDTIEELFYKGLAGTDLAEYYARNEIKIYVEKKFSQDGSQSFLERTVKEEYYTPDNNKEFVLNIEDPNPACKEYTVGTGTGGYWRDTGKPCYYK